MAERVWTCQRTVNKVKCGHKNPRRKRICEKCGKHRPATKKPEHMVALDYDYEYYKLLNGGEFCGICGRGPSANRRLDRDHDHKTGKPRGLLCATCNRRLTLRHTEKWLQNALDYLERTR